MSYARGWESPGQSPSEAKILGWTIGREDTEVDRLMRHNKDVVRFK